MNAKGKSLSERSPIARAARRLAGVEWRHVPRRTLTGVSPHRLSAALLAYIGFWSFTIATHCVYVLLCPS